MKKPRYFAVAGFFFIGQNRHSIQRLVAAGIAVTARVTFAATVAPHATQRVVQSFAQRLTAAVVAEVVGRSAGHFTAHFAADHAGAGHGFLVGNADADGAGHVARNLAGYALGVLFLTLRGLAFVGAHLDLLFL